MNPAFPFREGGSSSSSWHQYSSSSDGVPVAMEGLKEAGPPPFLVKAFDMVDDISTAHIVSWSRGGHSFVVWDPSAFSTFILPTYFKHNNFSSFVRQLNTYGFRKIDAEKWEFANSGFIRGEKHLLKHVRRRRTVAAAAAARPQQQAVVELGQFGQEAEVEQLRRDKKVLTMEVVKLRQEQESSRAHLQHVETRLRGTEKKQQQMMRFLAKAMHNPGFTRQLLEDKEKLLDGQVKVEEGFQVSELEALALQMQGLGKSRPLADGDGERELDEGFWDELLNHGFPTQDGRRNVGNKQQEDDDDDVNVLSDRFGFLGSTSK